MSNPKVREEVKNILRFWLDMGVDGFREDVITFIAKDEGLPNSYPALPVANGVNHYANRPMAHEYLKEFKRDVLDFYDCFTVGESPMTTADSALKYIAEGEDKVLDEMIAFTHMEADCFMLDMIRLPFNLVKMKRAFSEWQNKLQGRAWNALYIENHDHPRIISRYGSEEYRTESGKMLAAMYILQRGTPFVYQGQEIGMLNINLPELSMYKDVMAENNIDIASRFMPRSTAMKLLARSSRDNARTPFQWSGAPNAGFTTGTPWFTVNENYHEINAEDQENDPNSLLNFYRAILKFKKENPVAIWGDYTEYFPKDKNFYVYARSYQGKRLLVICSFTRKSLRFEAPEGFELVRGELVFSNYESNFAIMNGFTSRPYEMRVYAFE